MKTTIKVLSIILLGLILFFFLVLPAVLGFIATRSSNRAVGNAPENFEEITIKTEDNIKLSAWYKKPENGKVIILVHGSNNNRDNLKDFASMLGSNDYGVLSIDQRGHGESEGQTNKYGWKGVEDVGAALAFLKNQSDVKEIGAFGSSLGGEIVLESSSYYPEITAIISDGATYRYFDEFYDLEFASDFVRNISSLRVQDLFVQLFSHDSKPEKTILESLLESQKTKFLFIAAGNEQEEIDYNNMFQENTNGSGELWVIENVSHTKGYSENEEEYTKKVLEFFENNL